MTKEDFSALSPEVGNVWSKIPNDTKVVILRSKTGNSNDGVNNYSKNIHKTVKPPYYPLRKLNKDHLNDLLTEIISEYSLSENNEVDAH